MEKSDAVAVIHPLSSNIKSSLVGLRPANYPIGVRAYDSLDDLAIESQMLNGMTEVEAREMYGEDKAMIDRLAVMASGGRAVLAQTRRNVKVVLAELVGQNNLRRSVIIKDAFPSAGIIVTTDNLAELARTFKAQGHLSTSSSVLPPYIIGGVEGTIEVSDIPLVRETFEKALQAGNFAEAREAIPQVWRAVLTQ